MWYWFCLIGSVTLVIGAVAAILWWAWRQETAGRFADTLDRRFAKDKTEPKPLRAYLDWVNWRGELEQRVTVLENQVDNHTGWLETHNRFLNRLEQQGQTHFLDIRDLRMSLDTMGEAATPSRATESHIKGDPLAVERASTTLPTLRFSPSDPPIIKGGHAERLSEFAEPEDVLT